jgi:acylphosphatase
MVSGRVQGVFYRVTCAERARALGLAGWVRNASDGRVEAVFEGPDDAVEAIVAWCREGSPSARVVAVDVAEEAVEGEEGFRVTRGR